MENAPRSLPSQAKVLTEGGDLRSLNTGQTYGGLALLRQHTGQVWTFPGMKLSQGRYRQKSVASSAFVLLEHLYV